MRRLSGTDAAFLNMETRYWHQHVGGLTVLDKSEAPDYDFETFLEVLAERLPYAPKFRWRLKEVPLGLDRPVWIDDADFDLRHHVRRVGVPSPGGPRETAEITGEILGHQLDRRRPLWELWFLEGLANDRVAMVMKYHHCLLDGVAGASLATVLMDIEPNPTPDPDRTPPPETDIGFEPSDLELFARGVLPTLRTPLRVMRYGQQLFGRGIAAASYAQKGGKLPSLTDVPRTSINGVIGPRRALAFASVSLADVRAIKQHFDVKVNDVILALCSSALRGYLADNDELPDKPLMTGVPVSTRTGDDTAMDNQIAAMQVSLATHVADPAKRLRAIHQSSQSAKEMTEAVRVRQIQSIGETAPPVMLDLAVRVAAWTRLLSRMPTVMNTLISNVPGPPFPLYTAGARVTGIFPTSVIMEGMGLNITIFSYEDRIDFGLHMDPDLISDGWSLAERIPAAVVELMAAGGLGAPTPVVDPFGAKAAPPTAKEVDAPTTGVG